ncbi:alpha/beta hydrolase [Aldersonia sp. NBC_00410]|uniref:alpha/beta fold hydrolase n=1 Tax=Aldersonia sp. NBC_00410 TaxID=2975954 RepID=UPI00224E784D|nr:alpha/beta fold hydrolase [Aldersonia sp. NBC_00410]MCX5042931.1 alpha/beta hydrolase [Aldersonia sp. NBC_00410]
MVDVDFLPIEADDAPAPLPRRSTVVADDGVPIAVREYGPVRAGLTVVFLHGHCLHAESWVYLCRHLAPQWGSDVRIVSYDHRGHGSSGSAPVHTCTLDQLADDLDVVLRTIAPIGPVLLIGHSMGAMAALAYMRLHPELIGSRIVGLGLISTAAGGLTTLGLGRLLHRPTVSLLRGAVRCAPRTMSVSKRLGGRLCGRIARTASFGRGSVNPSVVALAAAMLNDTSIVTMTAFLGALVDLDESETLRLLTEIPVLVLVGSADLVTPPQHSLAIVAQLPDAEFVCIDGAGHSVILEDPAAVAASVVRLVARAGAAQYARAFASAG